MRLFRNNFKGLRIKMKLLKLHHHAIQIQSSQNKIYFQHIMLDNLACAFVDKQSVGR